MLRRSKSWKPVFDNDLDAFVPELWAQESLMILEANMIAANLCYRDFEPVISQFGDVVNTRQPGTFQMKRKTNADSVTIQNANATNVPVALNQHGHVSFMIKDGEQSKGFKNLVAEYLNPAVLAIAEGIDQTLLGQAYRFRAQSCGKLGTAPDKATVLAARELANLAKMPVGGRNFIVTAGVEADLLNIQDFVNAEKVGDDGTALREGSLGRKFGFDFYMCQQCPQIATGNSTTTTATTANTVVGQTVIPVTAFGPGAHPVGAYLTVAGDMTPQRIASIDDAAETITVTPGLASTTASGAVVTIYTPGQINNAGGYAADYLKDIAIDTFTVAPKMGQLTSFGTAAGEYAQIGTPTTTSMLLDVPLTASVADDAKVNIGPAGSYCFAFHRNALALVTRPLAMPEAGTGARAYVANFNGLSVRVVITYNGEKQGHLVTVDTLYGVKTLNSALGLVMYG